MAGLEAAPAPPARDRLIVALDVPSKDEALGLVRELQGLVSFFKVGLELVVSGEMRSLLEELPEDARVFLDLKLPSDIPETIHRTVRVISGQPAIELLTLCAATSEQAVRAAREGRGSRPTPKLLLVSLLSSMDATDLKKAVGTEDLMGHVRMQAMRARQWGCEGLIASGDAIGTVRKTYPEAIIGSPGIRLAGAATEDHKRSSTPAQAIRDGADYVVLGRPIRNAKDRRRTAQAVIDDLERGLQARWTEARS